MDVQVFIAMLAVMVAPSVGIDPLSVSFILNLIAVVAISSFGVADIGGGATFAALYCFIYNEFTSWNGFSSL